MPTSSAEIDIITSLINSSPGLAAACLICFIAYKAFAKMLGVFQDMIDALKEELRDMRNIQREDRKRISNVEADVKVVMDRSEQGRCK